MDVTIYTTHTCAFCAREKEFFGEHGIEYTEHYVDEDREKAEEMIKRSGQMGVPFTVIVDDEGEEHEILGFQQEKLKEVLGL